MHISAALLRHALSRSCAPDSKEPLAPPTLVHRLAVQPRRHPGQVGAGHPHHTGSPIHRGQAAAFGPAWLGRGLASQHGHQAHRQRFLRPGRVGARSSPAPREQRVRQHLVASRGTGSTGRSRIGLPKRCWPQHGGMPNPSQDLVEPDLALGGCDRIDAEVRRVHAGCQGHATRKKRCQARRMSPPSAQRIWMTCACGS